MKEAADKLPRVWKMHISATLYDCIILIGSQAVMYSWEKYRQTPLNLLDGQISKNCFLYDHLYQIASYKTS